MKKMPSSSYLKLVRSNANFRWLWGGQILSLLGDWFNLVASVALIASLTESGLAVGGLFVVRMLAPFLTSPVAGVLADRYSRQRIMVAADVTRGLIMLALISVCSLGLVWPIYLLTALQLGTSSFFFTARKAILPDIVEPPSIGVANAITSATWSLMLAVGAALGGLTTGWLGIHLAFLIDASTFFLSAILIAQIRLKRVHAESHDSSQVSVFRQFSDGLRYLSEHPDILAIALHKTALTLFFGTTFRVVQVAATDRIFSVGQQGGTELGLLFAVAGIGTGIGPLFLRYFVGDDEWGLRWAIAGGYAVGGLGLLISAQLAGFESMMAGAFLAGIGNGILWVFSSQLLLQLVTAKVRGRVFGTEFAMFTLASAVGSAIAGVAIDSSLGISGVLELMSFCSLVPATAWCIWLAWGFRTQRQSSEDRTPAVVRLTR